MKKDKEIHKENAKGLKRPKADIKVYWDIRNMVSEGEFYEDEHGREWQGLPDWERKLVVEEITFFEAVTIFDKENGDYDHSNTILFITDMNDKVLFDARVKRTTVHDCWDLYNSFKEEKDIYQKSQLAEKLINYLIERNKLRGKDKDRSRQYFINSMKYECQYDSQLENTGDEE